MWEILIAAYSFVGLEVTVPVLLVTSFLAILARQDSAVPFAPLQVDADSARVVVHPKLERIPVHPILSDEAAAQRIERGSPACRGHKKMAPFPWYPPPRPAQPLYQ